MRPSICLQQGGTTAADHPLADSISGTPLLTQPERLERRLKDIPADIEINEDNSSLDIFPYSPIPSNKDSYAIVFKKIFNPKKSGLKQFHSYGQYAQKNTSSRYLGSWTIVID